MYFEYGQKGKRNMFDVDFEVSRGRGRRLLESERVFLNEVYRKTEVFYPLPFLGVNPELAGLLGDRAGDSGDRLKSSICCDLPGVNGPEFASNICLIV